MRAITLWRDVDDHEMTYELGSGKGKLHTDLPAERVAEDVRRSDPFEIEELSDVRCHGGKREDIVMGGVAVIPEIRCDYPPPAFHPSGDGMPVLCRPEEPMQDNERRIAAAVFTKVQSHNRIPF